MCCHEQPPQPAATYGQGGSTRLGDASSTRSTTARAYRSRSSTIRATTASPGSAPRTKTTRPDASRATASPPAAIAVGRSSISSGPVIVEPYGSWATVDPDG